MKWTTFTTLVMTLAATQSQAAFFNDRAAVQGYLKQGSTPLNDATGFPMRFIVKQNSTVVWCQDSASPVAVANGVFTSVLSGSSNCSSLSNAFSPAVFNHTANTDAFTVSVVVDLNKDGFGGADDATFSGINLVSSPLAMVCNQANTALTANTATTATTATSASTATNATNAVNAVNATTAVNVSGVVAIANGGTGATSAAAARTALGLGGLAVMSTSGLSSDVLRGDGTWGSPGAALTSLNGLTAASQSFAIGSSGTSPAWSSASSSHTLNIPLASNASVTAGLISKTDYDSFNTKMSSSLASGNIFVGNASGVAASVTMSGDATMANTGVLTVAKTTTAQANKILSLDGSSIATMSGLALKGSVSGSATLQAAGTTTTYSLTLPAAQGAANQILANNGSGVLSWVTPMDLSSAQTVGGVKTFSSTPVFSSGLSISAGNITMPSASSITTSAGALTVTATTNLTVQGASGSATTIGNTGGASSTVVQAGTGKVKIGSTGTAFTASGACAVSSTAVSTTETNVTCTGVPASTSVAVVCSPAASLSAAVALYARATGTVNQVALRATASATAAAYTCMWMQP